MSASARRPPRNLEHPCPPRAGQAVGLVPALLPSLLWLLLLLAALPLRAQARLETLIASGPTASRVNIVVLSEGYTAADLVRFPNDARAVVNHLLDTPPYTAYRNHFNAFALSVPSAESGSDHPTRGLFRNTYFNSTYDSYGLSYLITIPPNDRDPEAVHGQGRVQALLQQFMPEYDLVLLLVNDTDYGGSGGEVAITSLNPSAREIAVHELGHSFAGLGDEYEAAFPGYPDIEEPNTTRETRRGFIKWNPWIHPTTPVPTPKIAAYQTLVGLFEGAHYHATGWYRPKQQCKMRTLGQAFCEVCAEALVLATYRLVDPIESVTPTAPQITVTNTPVYFSATLLDPAASDIETQWSLNGQILAGATASTLWLEPLDFQFGTNIVELVVHDDTLLVRSDPSRLLEGHRSWTVVRVAMTPEFRLLAPTWLKDGYFQFEVPPTSGQRVVIEQSSDASAWSDLHTNEGNAGFLFTYPAPASLLQFFRARAEP